jgi:HlyD family secretion protein
MSIRKRWLIIAALVAVIAAGLTLWQPWRKTETAVQYRLAKIERGPLSAAVSASGSLSALVTVQVGSQVSGLIQAIHADFNSEVKQGQVIARIDPQTFETRVAQAEADLRAAEGSAEVSRGNLAARRAEVAKARVGLEDARRSLARKQALVAQGFLSPAELDTAQAAADTAQEQLRLAQADEGTSAAQVGSAQAVIAQRRAALRQAQVELAHTVIRSPVDGVVIQRNVDVGQTVAASFQAPVLFTIARDLRQMEVNVAVDEADVGRVRTGQKVRFSVDAFPGERFGGAVTQIRKAPQTSNNVVTYSVMATVANPDLKLLPGMTANARIQTEERPDALKVANEALRFRPVNPDGTPMKLEVRNREEGPGTPGRVWVLGAGGQPAPVNVRLGVSDGKATEILKGDLREGQEVILGPVDAGAAKPKRATRPFGMGM